MTDETNNTNATEPTTPLEYRDSSGLEPNSDLTNDHTILRAIADTSVKRGTMTQEEADEALRGHGIEVDQRTDEQKGWDQTTPKRETTDYRFGELSRLFPDASHTELKGAHHTFAEFSAALRLAPTVARDFVQNAVKAGQTIQEVPEEQREAYLRNERQTLAGLFDNPQEVIDTVDAYLDAFPGEAATKLREAGAFSSAAVVAKLYWRIRHIQTRPRDPSV